MKLATAVLAATASLASAQQDLDVLVFVERFDTGEFEALIQVDAQPGLLTEVRLVEPGSPSIPFDQFDDEPSFEFDIDPDSSFEDFLTADATGETFDLQFGQSGGAVSVYRFAVDDVFGPQVDLATIPGVPSDLAVDANAPATLQWTAPSTTGTFVLVFGERDDFADEPLFVVSSPIPLTPAPLIQPPIGLDLADTSLELPSGALDGPLIALVTYGTSLGSFTPTLISGPPLNIGLSAGVVLSSSERAFDASGGCSIADLVPPFGVVDLFDIDAFIPLFLAGDPAVDFVDPVGVVDLDDLDVFISAFLVGCP